MVPDDMEDEIESARTDAQVSSLGDSECCH